MTQKTNVKRWFRVTYVTNFRGFHLQETFETSKNIAGVIKKVENRDDCVRVVSANLCDDRQKMNRVTGVTENGELVYDVEDTPDEFCERAKYLKDRGIDIEPYCRCTGKLDCTALPELRALLDHSAGCCEVGYPKTVGE